MTDTCRDCVFLEVRRRPYIGAMRSHYWWCHRRQAQVNINDAACADKSTGVYGLTGPRPVRETEEVGNE